MKITSICKAVGKYKEQYNQTGLLLADVEGAETWVSIEGQLNYQDYKNKQVTVDIRQNTKGYWDGTLVGGQQNAPQGASRPAQSKKSEPDWNAISTGKCRHGILCAEVGLRGVASINDSVMAKIIELTEFSMTGKLKGIPFDQFTKENPVENDDIPPDQFPSDDDGVF